MTKDLSNVAKVEFKEKCFNFFFNLCSRYNLHKKV